MTKWPTLMLATVLVIGLAYLAGYQRGTRIERQAQEAAQQRERADALANALTRIERTGKAVHTIGLQIRDAIAASHEQERVVVQTVTKVIHANPEFASSRRPAELERLRRTQLQAIADAADAQLPR